MRIELNGKNEFEFIPTIQGNDKEPKEKQWRIVVRKVNFYMESYKFDYTKSDGTTSYNVQNWLKTAIVRFENPPVLVPKDESGEKELTIDDFLSDKYPELFDTTQELFSFTLKLTQGEKEIETKKL